MRKQRPAVMEMVLSRAFTQLLSVLAIVQRAVCA
jgi:hypothetical protein